MTERKYEGELRIDDATGTILFLSYETGHVIFRVTDVPLPIPDPLAPMLDIKHPHASWEAKK